MIRILIVDDEEIERMALQKIIETEIEGVEVVGQAENGRQAIEQAELLTPDLILMDIKMPGIDGLLAIEEILKRSNPCKFIIVSSYDTFDYARQALRLGVKDYLLKPSVKDVIVSTVYKVVHEIKQERLEEKDWNLVQKQIERLLPILEADLVTQLLFDHVHEVHLRESMDILGLQASNHFYVMVLILSSKQSEKSSDREQVYRALKEQFDRCGKGWVGAMSGKQIPIVTFLDREKGSYRLQATLVSRNLLQLAQGFESEQLFIGIGGVYSSFDGIKHSYHEALLATVDLSKAGGYCLYEDLSYQQEKHTHFLLDLERKVLEEVRTGNWEEITHIIYQLIQYYQHEQKSVIEAQQRVYEVFLLIIRILEEMGFILDKPVFSFQVDHYQQLRTDAVYKLEKLIQSLTSLQERYEGDVAQRIKKYVMKNSSKEISLEMVADHVQLSPYYVSKLFKDEFSISYIDFLTDCRIQKAKDLICQGSLSLKEVAYEVGYSDPNYFSRVFKKTCGESATQYKNKLLNRRDQG